MSVIQPVIVAAVVAAVVTPVAAWVARRADIVDHPGPLKVQDRPVSYLGGLAVLVAIAVPIAEWHPVLLLPLGISALVGLVDDVADLSAQVRLACETVNGVIVAAVVIPPWHPLLALLAVLTVVLLINAVNLIDGLDGLASGVGVVGAIGFALALEGGTRPLALALVGALLGFLLWNRPPARIYLGDSGSYLIGTALAMLLVSSFADPQTRVHAGASLLFVAVPLADAGVAIVRRWRAGSPLLHGDRAHIYDQLVDRSGLSRPAATAACIGAQAVLVLAGLAIVRLPRPAGVVATIVCVVGLGVALLVAFTAPPALEG